MINLTIQNYQKKLLHYLWTAPQSCLNDCLINNDHCKHSWITEDRNSNIISNQHLLQLKIFWSQFASEVNAAGITQFTQ